MTILHPQVSRTVWAPWMPHRAFSCASPWNPRHSWTPWPPASAAQAGTGTGQIWVTSSRHSSSGGSSRWPDILAPICVARYSISVASAANSGASVQSSPPVDFAIMYSVPPDSRNLSMSNSCPRGGSVADGQLRVLQERQRTGYHHPDGPSRLVGGPGQFGELSGQFGVAASDEDVDGFAH